MPDIAQVCEQYSWLYSDLPAPAGTWDHVIPVDGAYAAIKNMDGVDFIMFRGSVTFLDWVEDLFNVLTPIVDPEIGPCHPGFLLGVRAIADRLDALVGPRVAVVGHSLGAGHAAIYAGLRAADGKPVERVIMFGEPRAGGAQLSAVLAKTPIWSFRNKDANGHDYVTDVPRAIPLVVDYQHPRQLTDVSRAPNPGDAWGLFRWHHFRLYAEALGATGPAVQSLPGG